ncbi:MAG: Crp/Fnr family transcriptional regulator [Deltaproteobacteria bacterium]|nr:Crp/Fnr family transcriptional regulator [Deltaproteobacteria bacterium]
MDLKTVIDSFPFFEKFQNEFSPSDPNSPVIKIFPKKTNLFFQGDDCSIIAFVLEGVIRVYKLAENGREMTLYRIKRGESCILTISCIIGRNRFPAFAVVDEEAKLLVVRAEVFKSWMSRYEELRDFVFELLSNRLAIVLQTVDEVVFKRLDIRIAEFLLKLAVDCGPLELTHKHIASELGTSREVVSRILKDFEREGIINISRGHIEIIKKEKLKMKLNLG